MATSTPSLSLHSILLLLLLVISHVHVMGSPLLPRALEMSKSDRKLKLDNRVVQITLTHMRQIESGVTGSITVLCHCNAACDPTFDLPHMREGDLVLNSESDEFTDEWRIYPSNRVGFGAVRDSAEVPLTSSNWPWRSHRFSELRRGTYNPTEVREKLAEVPLAVWNSLDTIKLFDHIEKRIPVEGRFRYPDAIMQYLWSIKVIQDSDIQKWNRRVEKMLGVEMSEVYVQKMKEIKDEAQKRQQSRLEE
ncbi:hypothetical protein EV359DRAFT_61851 [Lentinula novae-zelandiae]|nr:hypothetical protein EV359DRAFT_61851 [Lentinula novae-zelandiae]